MSSILDTAERIHAGLDVHLQRQNLLTANLTQIDTPNFRPLDLVRRPSFASTLDTAMTETEPAHQQAAASGVDRRFQVVHDPATMVGYDGNGVSVDREAVKIAANQIRYDALAQLEASELGGLGWAANDGRNG